MGYLLNRFFSSRISMNMLFQKTLDLLRLLLIKVIPFPGRFFSIMGENHFISMVPRINDTSICGRITWLFGKLSGGIVEMVIKVSVSGEQIRKIKDLFNSRQDMAQKMIHYTIIDMI